MCAADSPSSPTAQIGAAVEHGPSDAWTRRSGNDRLTSPPCRGKAHRGSGAGTFIVVVFFFSFFLYFAPPEDTDGPSSSL